MISAVAALALSSFSPATPKPAPAATPSDSVVVITLGTGTPVPNPRAAGPATAVVVGSRVFLFDAGDNVERQLASANLPVDGVEAVFFTHLHSDHVLGYPDLIFSSWVAGRRSALKAFGPPGLKAMTTHLIAAFSDDIAVRTSGLEKAVKTGYFVNARETRGGLVYDSGGVRVTAFRVPHGAWPVALGYRISAMGKAIVISGDTKFSNEVMRQSKGVDVLVHEVYASSRVDPKETLPSGANWPKYLVSAHTSDLEVGRIAASSNPKLVILTHVISMGAADDVMIAAVRSGGYKGRVVVGHDLDRY